MPAICRAGLGAILVVVATQTASGQELPEVLFVFDASGSMRESAGTMEKIDAAKSVMKGIVPQLDPAVGAGLVAYGHRRRGDCRDIEVLVPPGGTDRQALLGKVINLEPQGMTPITDALSVAIELLKLKENETTIVLVSDGMETCNADPCAVVKKLKATGIKFIVHSVGFQVDRNARAQLECISQETGGKYFQADDAAGLLTALQNINEEIDQKVEAAKTTVTQAGTGLGRIELEMPESTLRGMAGLEIVRTKDEKVVKKTEGLPAKSTHPLLDGQYDVWYLFAQPNYGEPTRTKLGRVEVKRGATARIVMGAIEFNLADAFATQIAVDQVVVVDSGSRQPVAVVDDRGNGYYNFVPKAVLPGVYDVQIRYANSPHHATIASRVSVSAGKRSVVTLDSGIKMKPAATTNVTGWDLVWTVSDAVDEGDTTEGEPAGSDPLLQARPPFGNKSTLWMPYAVPPGTYTLQVHVDGMDEPLPVAEDLDIQKGQLLEFDSGL